MALLTHAQPEAIAAAAQHLARGGLLGLPTETVYGLAADVGNDAAVRAIFAAKGRPADHPLIAHIAAPDDGDWAAALAPFAQRVPDWALRAAAQLWPGPLTLVLPRRAGICELAAGGLPTLAVRCPAHPAAQAILRAAQALGVMGVAAPSANRFGRVSPTTAQHVLDEFADRLDDRALLIVDGGACDVGIESTIVDASRAQPVLLRPGMLPPDTLAQALGQAVAPPDAQAPKVSGSLASHYAPRARVHLLPPDAIAPRWAALSPSARAHTAVYAPLPVLQQLSASAAGGAAIGAAIGAESAAATKTPHHAMPQDPAACAHELFAVLRALDQAHIQDIWVAQAPDTPAWAGVNDRLRRAAA